MVDRTNTAVWVAKEGRWRIRVQRDGQRRAFYSSTPGRTGQREANARADAWLDNPKQDTKARVRDRVPDYLESVRISTASCTYDKAVSITQTWILPYLGSKRFDALCDQDIQHMLDTAVAAGRAKKTVQNILAETTKYLKYCRRRGITPYTPEFVGVGKAARSKGKRVLQPAELRILFAVDTYQQYNKTVPCPYINAYRHQAIAGLRPGEIKGLKWEDVQGDRLYIRRSINEAGEVTRGKNENAIRAHTMTVLERQIVERQRQLSNGEYVYNISPVASDYRKQWICYCESNGIQYVSPYELRHTYVSAVKVLPEGMVKGLVGHSRSMDTFGVYGHALEGDDDLVASKVAEVFARLLHG